MTDKERLNRLMAEAIGWFVLEWPPEAHTKLSFPCILNTHSDKHVYQLYEHLTDWDARASVRWQPATRIEQAMIVLDKVMDGLLASHCTVDYHPGWSRVRIAWLVQKQLQDSRSAAESLAEAICLAVEAAIAVRDA